MVSDINRRNVLKGAAAVGALGCSQNSRADGTEPVAMPGPPIPPASGPATHHIGAPAARVDGVAKVTGAAKYAAEYKPEGLAYGSVVTSRIAKGGIVRIDASEALRV